ncbi:S-layer homology domain-containing protein [Desulfitibacter alkalitolerans]|uniref:S-layer homology domain-containing protein n=1 Tax=Desulfitibacter alkalitolerans TaxID=264641 RepID=UPI0004828F8A|nr:S-layer homology domain-containing protein [Desulfitibacter alkalitolerans]
MKRMMSVILTVAMLLSIMIPVAAVSPREFTDIPDDWSKEAVIAAISNGLISGSGNRIMPKADLKRCEMAAIMNRAFGATQKGDISKYTDTSTDKWYADDMAKAVQMGTFIGHGSLMRPEDPITRQEVFVVLARALKLSTGDYSSLDKFSDKTDISDWAKPELAALAAAGYVKGDGRYLYPLANISRAEFAQVMHNIIKTYIKTSGTYTTVSSGNLMINAPDVTLKGVSVEGDLIIGDGVGTGSVTLDDVKIKGRTVIRGGGKNSIHIINGTTINGTVIIDNVNNEIRFVTDQNTTVQKIEAGSQVVLEGSFGEVKVVAGASRASDTTRIEVKGIVQTMTVEVKADISVTSGMVSSIAIAQTAGGTAINANEGAVVGTVVANARTNITGSGTVSSVQANANDVKIDTVGTSVTAAQGVTGVTAGGTEVKAGTTVTIPPAVSTTPSTGGGGGSSGGGSGGGSTPTNPLSGGYIGNYTASSAGTYGPASGSATVDGNVTVSVADVTLRNLVITGSLIFDAGIGNGNAYVSNVVVQGKTIIQGGGSNSIHIQGASSLGIIEVDDKRDDKTQPINISAEGTIDIPAVNVKSETPVKITAVTDTIGFVAAVDGSEVTYGETAYKNELLGRIVQKADYVLGRTFINEENDSEVEINPQFDDLVSDIIDEETRNTQFYQDYKVAFLKYYINPLDKAPEFLDEYIRLTEKLSDKWNTVGVIGLRNNPDSFNEHMYDHQFPSPDNYSVLFVGENLGPHQLAVNNEYDIYDRVTTNLGYSDPGGVILNKLKALQTVSVLYSVEIVDEDGSGGITQGDKVVITFKRQLGEVGKQAFQGLSPSYGDFGTNPGYLWDMVEIADFSGSFNVSRCTIALGENPMDFIGATLTIPKNQLESIKPGGAPSVGMLTDLQPVFDIDITLENSEIASPPPGGGGGPAPVVQSISVVDAVYNSEHRGALALGDLIVIIFDKPLNFGQMDGITLAFAEEDNVFGIPTGLYSNRNDVNGVQWSDDDRTVVITLQDGFILDFDDANTIHYTGGGISVNVTIGGFTDGVSSVIVESNGDNYDIFVTFINSGDNADNPDLMDALALALSGERDDSGSSGTTIIITGVSSDNFGTEVALPHQHTFCKIGFGFIVPAEQ